VNHKKPTLEKIRAYRRALQNPYACLEDLEEIGALAPDERMAAQPPRERDASESGNPYASLTPWWDVDAPARAVDLAPKAQKDATEEEFAQYCRRVFRQYRPRHGSRTLRPHEQAFIERNVGASGRRRRSLMNELARYDLGNVVKSHFNRENSELSAQKLAEIESRVAAD